MLQRAMLVTVFGMPDYTRIVVQADVRDLSGSVADCSFPPQIDDILDAGGDAASQTVMCTDLRCTFCHPG